MSAARPTPTLLQMCKLLDRFVGTVGKEDHIFDPEDVSLLCRFVSRDHPNGELTAALEKRGYSTELDLLNTAMGAGRVKLTPAHEEQGIAWLWQNRTKLKLGTHEKVALRNNPKFTLVGVAQNGTQTAPIYCVRGGEHSFNYEAWSWQSGIAARLV